jgi:hypothetical protein
MERNTLPGASDLSFRAVLLRQGFEPAGHIAICRIWFAILRTTLNINDRLMARLRRESARQNRTMSELVEAAPRLLFQSGKQKRKQKLPPLPTFHGGGHLVDIAERNALYDVMKGWR